MMLPGATAAIFQHHGKCSAEGDAIAALLVLAVDMAVAVAVAVEWEREREQEPWLAGWLAG